MSYAEGALPLPMKAIVLHQPWATLVALDVKWIETRDNPPSGSLRPAGVRGLPGFGVEPGERIAIVAGKQPIRSKLTVGRFEAWPADPPGRIHVNHEAERPCRLYDNGASFMSGGTWIELPLGAVVATAKLTGAVPMQEPDDPTEPGRPFMLVKSRHGNNPDWLGYYRPDERLRPPTTWDYREVTDQRPYGFFERGRWAWLLDDIRPVPEPLPVKGGRGVFEIPALSLLEAQP